MKHMTRFTRTMALVLTLVLLAGSLPARVRAASSDEIRGQLQELKEKNKGIQAELAAVQSRYDANADEIQSIVDQKDAIDQEIALLNSQIINLNDQITAYSQLIADSQDQLDEAEVHLDELNQIHKERIRAMEEEGGISYWEVIFQASSYTDLLDRLNMMEEISASDQRRLDEMRQAAETVEHTRQTMEDEKKGLEESKLALEDAQVLQEEKRKEADDLIRQLLEKEEEIKALLMESQEKVDAVLEEISKKERELEKAKQDEYLAKLAAQGSAPPSNATWVRPLSSLRVTSPFGTRIHPITGVKRVHKGVDFGAPSGTPIYATRAGTVTTATYQAGGAGYYVNISHGDGFSSIYMHMTNYIVHAGQQVSQGQVIGYVGSTGMSTGPHLHFGVAYGGQYVNPLAYIY